MKKAIVNGITTEYMVTEDGRVFSPRGKELKGSITPAGYKIVGILGKNIFVHRIIAETFIGPCLPETNTINHIDGNKLNNTKPNLEWLSLVDNLRHSWSSGLNGRRSDWTDMSPGFNRFISIYPNPASLKKYRVIFTLSKGKQTSGKYFHTLSEAVLYVKEHIFEKTGIRFNPDMYSHVATTEV